MLVCLFLNWQTAYEVRSSDVSSGGFSSDLVGRSAKKLRLLTIARCGMSRDSESGWPGYCSCFVLTISAINDSKNQRVMSYAARWTPELVRGDGGDEGDQLASASAMSLRVLAMP